jgi:hypothetical protein
VLLKKKLILMALAFIFYIPQSPSNGKLFVPYFESGLYHVFKRGSCLRLLSTAVRKGSSETNYFIPKNFVLGHIPIRNRWRLISIALMKANSERNCFIPKHFVLGYIPMRSRWCLILGAAHTITLKEGVVCA